MISGRPKLVYATVLPLIAYVALTAIWVLPEWGCYEATQAFSIAKHLVIILLIVASLFFFPRIGCWVALVWCAFAPIERYGMLYEDISAVTAGGAWSIETVDVVRIFLLLTACILAAVLAFDFRFRPKTTINAQIDA